MTDRQNRAYYIDISFKLHSIYHSSVILTRIYQDPSMKIPSWMAICRGKKQTLINTPSRSLSDDQASS